MEFHNPTFPGQCFFKSILFDSLTPDEIHLMDDVKTEIKYKKGEIICHEGDEINAFYHLKNGLVKLYKIDKSGKEHIISIAKPFDFIGLLSTFSQSHYQYSIAAIEDSVFCVFDIAAIKKLVLLNSKFGMALIENISKITEHVINTRFELNGKLLRGRIAYILLYFSQNVYKSNHFELPLSRKEIAELIDMTTENVIRILSEFRKDQIIKIEGKQIRVLNEDMLRKISVAG